MTLQRSPFRTYDTKTAAAVLVAKENTLRVALSQHGHYLGIRPTKLANRRLVWPADQVDALAQGRTAPVPNAAE